MRAVGAVLVLSALFLAFYNGETRHHINALLDAFDMLDASQEENPHRDDSIDGIQAARAIAQDRGLFIVVESWAGEGIAAWRIALSELILMAKAVNATIVEPSIHRGRPASPGQGNFTLFDVFNRTFIDQVYSKWISADEYYAMIQANRVRYFDLCVGHRGHPKCNAPSQSKRNETELINSTVLRHALQMLQAPETESDIVTLRIFNLWKEVIRNMRSTSDPSTTIMAKEEIGVVMRRHFEFSPFLHAMADKALELMGIAAQEEYAVVHWRGEKPNLDFLGCAEKIAEAKTAMLEQENTTIPFVLMSSISSNIENVWSPGQKHVNATAAEALQFLTQDHGFKKSDGVLPQQKDMIVYVGVDLILAQRATSFSTCTGCRDDWCKACNYPGRFSQLAIEYRNRLSAKKDSTFKCWPRKKNKTLVH